MFHITFIDKGHHSKLGVGPVTIEDILTFAEDKFFRGSWDATRTSLSVAGSTALFAGAGWSFGCVKNYLLKSRMAWASPLDWKKCPESSNDWKKWQNFPSA